MLPAAGCKGARKAAILSPLFSFLLFLRVLREEIFIAE